MVFYRIFRGDSTRQRDGVSGEPADPGAFYYEPQDYEGDVLWSEGYVSPVDAEEAAGAEEAAPEHN